MLPVNFRKKILLIGALGGIAALAWWGLRSNEAALLQLHLYELLARALPATPRPPTVVPDYAQQIRELTQQLQQKDAEIYRLERALREFENFRNALPELKIIATSVIGNALTNAEIVVDVGRDVGVENGYAAVQGQTLVGVIGLAGEKSSYVMLTENAGCLVPARAEKSRDACSVRGVGNGRALATFYANQTATSPGEILLTSGLLGKIPAGLIIGTIEDYPLRGANAGTLEAPVKLAANFAAVEYLLLVFPPEKKPPEK